MKVVITKNKHTGDKEYHLCAPHGLVYYGVSKDICIIGAGFRAGWAVAKLYPSYSSLAELKAAGKKVIGSFNVESTYDK